MTHGIKSYYSQLQTVLQTCLADIMELLPDLNKFQLQYVFEFGVGHTNTSRRPSTYKRSHSGCSLSTNDITDISLTASDNADQKIGFLSAILFARRDGLAYLLLPNGWCQIVSDCVLHERTQ